MIDLVGLADVAAKRVGGFSLGMGQRLGIAAALLGNPRVVILDEPVNGLDPEGVLWVRNLLKALAADGHTVFVSSHLMSEMALTATACRHRPRQADRRHHRRRAHRAGRRQQRYRPHAAAGRAPRGPARPRDHGGQRDPGAAGRRGPVNGADRHHRWQAHLPVFELTAREASLEEAFMQLTEESVDYRSHEPAMAGAVR